MSFIRIGTCFMLGILAYHRADAMFLQFEIRQVPIARVFTNLQLRLMRNTNDFELNYYLARLHSMAFSTDLLEIGVRTNKDLPVFSSPWSDGGVPPSVQSFATPEARKLALNHLTNAILLFERAIVL